MAVDILDQANAPQGRRLPLAAAGLEIGPAIGQAVTHVVEQQIGVGPDALAVQRRAGELRKRSCRSGIALPVAGGALGFRKQLLTVHGLRVLCIPACRRRQRSLVEHHIVQRLVIDFRTFAMRTARRFQAVGLCRASALVTRP